MQQRHSIHYALLSVYDKTGIVEFATNLSKRGIKIFSTSGTANLLLKNGLSVIEVSDYTNFPEIMNGRIKTLHPKIHAGILGCRGQDDDIMDQYGIVSIDMVVVNLYPITKLDRYDHDSLKDLMKNIDIGGQTMIRSAAKNCGEVAVIVENDDYHNIIKEMDANEGSISMNTCFNLAIKAFKYTSTYDGLIANYFSRLALSYYNDIHKRFYSYFPKTLNLHLIKKYNLRYGENNHQRAAFYIEKNIETASSDIIKQQLQGRKLSYNNIVDYNLAVECVMTFNRPACTIVKHATPCGVAMSSSTLEAYKLAYKADPISAFGGTVAFNCELDDEVMQTMLTRQFVEVIVAPSITDKALEIAATKPSIRVLVCRCLTECKCNLDIKMVNGGFLIQEHDSRVISANDLNIVTWRQPSERELHDALFSWKVVKFVKSNAIVYAKNNMTIGIGTGQLSRIYSIKIAKMKAENEGLEIKGSVMASDAFISFRDNIDIAVSAGVSCIIQPGGSIHDKELISIANEYGITMIFTNTRHFYH